MAALCLIVGTIPQRFINNANMLTYNAFWFRRDLRLNDHSALFQALHSPHRVLPLFIFDTNILNDLSDRQDPRVQFIYNALLKIDEDLKRVGSALLVYIGDPLSVWQQVLQTYKLETVFATTDYEPYARKRDDQVKQLLNANGLGFTTIKDQVIFEKDELLKPDGSPYNVFTPYSKRWISKEPEFLTYNSQGLLGNFAKLTEQKFPSLHEIGFKPSNIVFPKAEISTETLQHYDQHRDFPALDATSRLGIHLRFGTLSIRQLAAEAQKTSPVFLNELIWREFYMMILWHYPKVVSQSFKPAYDNIQWINNAEDFEHWKTGTTGYPLVDAGMRQLKQTGFMHNRLRMLTASFLTKHLLIDWRWGEAYFAEKLLDFELASNNGGWQWAAGTGVDAAPYFRIFSPDAQTKRFDPQLSFIKKWVPEFQELNYPKPIVNHEFARKRLIAVYQQALKDG
jgi:deoxyribodipyrimidine photo-lyase